MNDFASQNGRMQNSLDVENQLELNMFEIRCFDIIILQGQNASKHQCSENMNIWPRENIIPMKVLTTIRKYNPFRKYENGSAKWRFYHVGIRAGRV